MRTLGIGWAGLALVAVGLGGCGGTDDSSSGKSGGAGAGGSGGTAGTAGSGGGGASSGGSGADGTGGVPEDVGTFTGLTGVQNKIAVAQGADCYLDAQGIIDCGDSMRWDDTPTAPVATFDTGDEQGCGLDTEGQLHCWGENVNPPPSGPFTAVAVGDEVACGVRPNGRIDCWGDEHNEALTPPEGTFVDVVLDDDWGCALDTNGDIACWGYGVDDGQTYPGPYQQLAAGESNLCALTPSGEARCLDGYMSGREVATGTFRHISVGSDHACGVREDGSVTCWESGEMVRLPAPEGVWEQVSSYYRYSCLRDAGGTLACWGPGKGDGAATLQCEPGSAELAGTLDGAAWSATLDTSAQYGAYSSSDPGYRFGYSISMTDTVGPGLLVFDGSDDFSSASARSALTDGEVVAADRVRLLTGGSLTDAGTMYCSASGSTLTLNIDEVLVDIPNLHALGTCSDGAAVDGTLSLSTSSTGLSGTLDGVTLEPGIGIGQGRSGIGTDGSGLGEYNTSDGGLFRISWAADGTVLWAVYVSPVASGLGGAAYCSGGTATQVDTTSVSFELTGFTRFADCPADASTDSLSGCVR